MLGTDKADSFSLLSSSLSSIYLQVCSVCKRKYSRSYDWLKHLTEEYHQKLARLECIEKWDCNLRKCCLIVYTSERLTDSNCGEIVNYFSKEFYGDMVTNFVWWEDRPHFAILQFESMEKTENILKYSNCDNFVKISISESQCVQVKKGSNLLELEWLSILPPKNPKSPSNRNSNQLSENEISLINRQDDSLALTLAPNENSVRKVKVEVFDNANESDVPPTPKRRRNIDDNNNSCAEFEINSSELLTNPINQSAVIPNKPILSVANPDTSTSPPFPWTREKHPLQFEYWKIQKNLHNQNPPEIQTSLVTVDDEYCRLFDYLCKFDTRSRYLITLVTNWLTLNSTNLTNKTEQDISLDLPSSYTVPWLVIFFLSAKAYIPTPRQILLRNPDLIKLKDKFSIGFHCDPTYVEEWKLEKEKNPTFFKKGNLEKPPKQDFSYCIPSDEFSDEFLLSVFQLLWKFLHFYQSAWAGGNEPVGSLLEGQVISIGLLLQPLRCNLSKIVENKGPTYWGNAMSTKELDTLVIAVKKERESKEFCGVYLTHPLNLSQKIGLAKDIKISLKHFTNGYPIIKKFVNRVELVGVNVGLMEFGRLINVLTFKKKDWIAKLKKRIILTRKIECE